VEPGGSLLYSKQPATVLYPEPTESNLNSHILLLNGHFKPFRKGTEILIKVI